jgi:ADP-ribose pyrophosphatase YjhB (NUDIX family)
MDITFETEAGRFNYRVCAVLLDGERILAMHDERSPYFYLPGGRVRMGERAEDAVLREVREELGIEARILRPLWLSQSFFNEDVAHVEYHELCLYFLVDASATDLLTRGGPVPGPGASPRPRLRMAALRAIEG